MLVVPNVPSCRERNQNQPELKANGGLNFGFRRPYYGWAVYHRPARVQRSLTSETIDIRNLPMCNFGRSRPPESWCEALKVMGK